MNVWTLLAIVAGLAPGGGYLSWHAGRLDRLHSRTNAAWASLDAQLVRRAAVTAELAYEAARRGLLGGDDVAALVGTAQQSLEASTGRGRAAVENALGHALRHALSGSAGARLSGDDG